MASIEKFPKTLFIVPDGNRRQAFRQGLSTWNGHLAGYITFKSIFNAVWEYETVRNFVFWGLSRDNYLKRPPTEIEFLCCLLRQAIEEVAAQLADNKREIRFRAVGEWAEYFSPELQKQIVTLEQKTAHHQKRQFSLLLAYDGEREMLQAAQKMHLASPRSGTMDRNLLYSCLPSGHIPPVDLYIRTGCESDPHLSGGALMFQMANAQLVFTRTLWPDFTTGEFEAIMQNYAQCERRFGA